MKTTLLATLGILAGASAFATAEEKREPGPRPDRPAREIPAEVIARFDKDGDGKLNEEELKAFREESRAQAEKRRQEMLEKYDTDKDGRLSEEERAVMRADREKELLKRFDKDRDGKLDEEELKAMREARPEARHWRGERGPRGERRPRPDREGPPPAPPAPPAGD